MRLKSQIFDLVVVFFLVALSGNPAISYFLGKEAALIGLPLALFAYGLIFGIRLRRLDIWVIFVFALLILCHLIEFGFGVIPASLGILLKLAAAVLVVRVTKNFADLYVKLMYWLALISFVFLVPQLLSRELVLRALAPIAIPYVEGVVHIGIHNFGPENHAFRNAGFFWEAGAFAGYLLLALVFELMKSIRLSREIRFGFRQQIIALAIVSTQSTTGFVVLAYFFLIFSFLKYKFRRIGYLAIVVLLMLPVAYYSYMELPFLGEKIDSQLADTVEQNDRSELTRFGNIVYDFRFIAERPLVGWSANPDTRLTLDSMVNDWVIGQGNGLTGFWVRFGSVGLVFYILFLYRSFFFNSKSVIFSIASVLTILLILNGEQYLNYPMFFTLMFLGADQSDYLEKRRKIVFFRSAM